jgi:hypothetical protein
MRTVFQYFSSAALPREARRNYRFELTYYILWVCLVSAIDPNVNAIVSIKTFGAPAWLAAAIWPIPILANLLNVVWGVVLRGRRRVPAMMALTAGVSIAVIALGFVPMMPDSYLDAVIYAALLAVAFVCLSGLLTLRASLWQVNYPSTQRAQIAGRIQVVRLLGRLVVPLPLALLYDQIPGAFHVVYPAAGVMGLLALIPLSRIRVAEEDQEITRLRERLTASGQPTHRGGQFWHGMRETFDVVHRDRLYANYLSAQFLLGSANFFTEPALIVVLTKQLGLSYAGATGIMTTVRVLTMLVLTPRWSEMFDRLGIFRFRVLNSGFWCVAHGMTSASLLVLVADPGLLPLAIILLLLGRIFSGVAGAGGMIGWQLGHLAFAEDHNANLYLGVHAALTGVRALAFPQISQACFALFGNPAITGALLLATTGHLLFRGLSRTKRAREIEAKQREHRPVEVDESESDCAAPAATVGDPAATR